MARPVTVITGASSGIGAEFARACARRGEALVLIARRKERLDDLAAEVGGAEVVVADLGQDGAATEVAAEIGRRKLALRHQLQPGMRPLFCQA